MLGERVLGGRPRILPLPIRFSRSEANGPESLKPIIGKS